MNQHEDFWLEWLDENDANVATFVTETNAGENETADTAVLDQDREISPEDSLLDTNSDPINQRELDDEREELRRIAAAARISAKKAKEKEAKSNLSDLLDGLHQETASPAAEDSTLPPTPSTWEEALSGPDKKHWEAARLKELLGLESQSTWEEAPEHKGRTVKSKWAFRVSREPDGTIKYRARLVAKGFSEIHGVDYFQTFAPTVSTKSLLILLHLAAANNWEIRSIDVGNAYLEADIDTELYMELPKESKTAPRQVVRLLKSLYGLKQAGELWNRRLHGILESMGFKRCFSDCCVYKRPSPKGDLYLAVYVDDILILGGALSELLDFESTLATHVKKLTIKGDAEGFVGFEFKRDRERRIITLTQSQFINDTLHAEGLSEAKTKTTPGMSTVDLNKAARGDPANPQPMREVVGKIRYAVDHSHPEGLFTASQLSSAAADPGEAHLQASTHMLRYLKGASNIGITLGGLAPLSPEIYVDASYIEEGEARSQCGLCVRLNSVAGMIYSRS